MGSMQFGNPQSAPPNNCTRCCDANMLSPLFGWGICHNNPNSYYCYLPQGGACWMSCGTSGGSDTGYEDDTDGSEFNPLTTDPLSKIVGTDKETRDWTGTTQGEK